MALGITDTYTIDPRIATRGFGIVSYGTDDSLLVKFSKKLVERGLDGGGVTTKEVEWVDIIIPGGDETGHEVTDRDRARFPRQYQNFLMNKSENIEGDALANWPMIAPSELEALRHNKVFSVQQLASLSDAQCQNVGMGMTVLRQKAKLFLESKTDSKQIEKVVQENSALKEQLTSMQEQIAELSKLIPKPKKSSKNTDDDEEHAFKGLKV